LGTPPQGRADYAFFGHILASLKPKTGRCAILFPHGVLFRDEEQEMRAKLVDMDQIECVLGLGPNLFYNSPMEACVVVCRSAKPRVRRNKILFINAVNEVTRERAQSFLEEEHTQKILKAYQQFADVDGFARVVTLDEIRANKANLSIPLYIRSNATGTTNTASKKPLSQVIQDWQSSSKALRSSMDKLLVTVHQTTEP
jgi:type I restriction enzyme M protein